MELLPLGFLESFRANDEGPDEVLYEDNLIRVERRDNKIIQTGKPIRSPFIYDDEESSK